VDGLLWCLGFWLGGHFGAHLAAFTRTFKGDWGQRHQVEDQGGWRHAPCLPYRNPAPKHQIKKTQIQTYKGNNMQKILKQKTEKTQNRIQSLTAALTALILVTGCQSPGSKQNKAMTHVLTQQEILIDTIVAERKRQKEKSEIRKSESLTEAELHLAAALMH